MNSFPLPSFEVLENTAAWFAVFASVNLYDAELGTLKLDLEASQSVEVDLYLPGEFAVRVPAGAAAPEYCITIRCTGVSVLRAEDIRPQMVVGDYAFDRLPAEQRALRIRGALGGDVEIQCRSIAVARVTPGPPAA